MMLVNLLRMLPAFWEQHWMKKGIYGSGILIFCCNVEERACWMERIGLDSDFQDALDLALCIQFFHGYVTGGRGESQPSSLHRQNALLD